jgi:hypothetical protein
MVGPFVDSIHERIASVKLMNAEACEGQPICKGFCKLMIFCGIEDQCQLSRVAMCFRWARLTISLPT